MKSEIKQMGKYNRFYITTVILIIISCLFISCEAPRSNPVDPLNDVNSSMASISGRVESLSLPHEGLSEVLVYWRPGNRYVKTGADGSFSFHGLVPEMGYLLFEKEGFWSDSSFVLWESKNIDTRFYLNKIPEVDTFLISSSTVKGMNGESVYELNIKAKILDTDNDVDTVFIINPDLNLKKLMTFDMDDGYFKTTIEEPDINLSNFEQVLGHDFNIIIKDIFNRELTAGSRQVIRVIKESVELLSPINSEAVLPKPVFRWNNFAAEYEFTYTLQVFVNDISMPRLVFSRENIPPGITTISLTDDLPARDYYWVVWAEDKFYNRSRSVPGLFIVN